MSHMRRFDHVGITVADLDTVTAFFVGLGLDVEGRTFVEGEFVDTVIGIPDSRSHMVMLRPPERGAGLELSRFVRPDHEPGLPTAMANELGLRNVAFEVDDLQATVDRLAADGYAWSAASVSTRTSGAWPTCAGRRGSSSPWLTGSADAPRRRSPWGHMPRVCGVVTGSRDKPASAGLGDNENGGAATDLATGPAPAALTRPTRPSATQHARRIRARSRRLRNERRRSRPPSASGSSPVQLRGRLLVLRLLPRPNAPVRHS